MNKTILIGNISTDLELQQTQSGTSFLRFSVACNRRVPNAQGVREADFINCVAFRQTAEFIARYFLKGSKIAIDGHIRTGSYTAQDGSKRYTTDVVVDNAEFCERATRSDNSSYGSYNEAPPPEAPAYNQQMSMTENGFTEVSDDDELPF